MRHPRLHPTLGFLLLSACFALGLLAPAPAAPAPATLPAPRPEVPPEQGCWNIKTTICTDCADADSKFCDPRSADGPYTSCNQTLTAPCPGFTCSSVDAQTGPPCS